MKTGKYAIPPGPGSFTIAFAGTGSRILSWVKCGDVTLTNFFKAGVLAAGAVWPNVAVSITASRNPGGEVGIGLLVSAPLGFSTGWETLEHGNVMQAPYYYADERSEEFFDENGTPAIIKTGAATAFYQTFRRNFPCNFNIKDLSEWSSQGELANVALWTIGVDAYVDDVFKVLLESIYDVLESQ